MGSICQWRNEGKKEGSILPWNGTRVWPGKGNQLPAKSVFHSVCVPLVLISRPVIKSCKSQSQYPKCQLHLLQMSNVFFKCLFMSTRKKSGNGEKEGSRLVHSGFPPSQTPWTREWGKECIVLMVYKVGEIVVVAVWRKLVSKKWSTRKKAQKRWVCRVAPLWERRKCCLVQKFNWDLW